MKKSILLSFIILAGMALNAQITHRIRMITPDTQCIGNNNFCFTDSIFPDSGITAKRVTYLFTDGKKIEFKPILNNVVTICHTFQDPSGGKFGIMIEIEDSSGEIIKQVLMDNMHVIDCNTVGIESIEENDIFISMDLDKGTFDLHNVNFETFDIQFKDINGRTVDMQIIDTVNNVVRVDPGTVNSGIYIIELKNKTNNKHLVLKVNI